VRVLSPDQVGYSVERGERIGVREASGARRRWQMFASGELGEQARSLRDENTALEWLRGSLPQAGSQLRLSRLDQALLRPFARWKTLHAASPVLREIFFARGDLFVRTRLLRWQKAGALFVKPAAGKSPYTDHELLLTPLGRRLLRGMRSLDEAPPMFIGGHEAYGPRSWLLTSSGSLRRA
jgi:hypothetical protein